MNRFPGTKVSQRLIESEAGGRRSCYPGGSSGCLCRSLSRSRGSASALSLSRPVQAIHSP